MTEGGAAGFPGFAQGLEGEEEMSGWEGRRTREGSRRLFGGAASSCAREIEKVSVSIGLVPHLGPSSSPPPSLSLSHSSKPCPPCPSAPLLPSEIKPSSNRATQTTHEYSSQLSNKAFACYSRPNPNRQRTHQLPFSPSPLLPFLDSWH